MSGPYVGEHRGAVTPAVVSADLLRVDAGNRALRTAIQGVVSAFLLGAVAALIPLVSPGMNLLDSSVLQMMGSAALTAGVMSVLAYVNRRFVDPSPIPSPLPPSPQAAPVDPIGDDPAEFLP